MPPPLPTRHRRGRRRLRAAVVGRRRRARRRPGDRRVTTSRATGSTARPIPTSATRRSSRPARGNPGPIGNGKPIAQFDLVDGRSGFSRKTVEGVAYYLGDDTGITPHLDRHHGHQRPAVLLRGLRLRLRLRPEPTRLARLLPVGERDHGLAHAARRHRSCRRTSSRCGPNRGCSGFVPRRRRRRRTHVAGTRRRARSRSRSSTPTWCPTATCTHGRVRARRAPDSIRADDATRCATAPTHAGAVRRRPRPRRARASGRSARACCRVVTTGDGGHGRLGAHRIRAPASTTDDAAPGARYQPRAADQPAAPRLSRRHHDRVRRRRGRHLARVIGRFQRDARQVPRPRPHRAAATCRSTSASATSTPTGTLSRADEYIDIVTYVPVAPRPSRSRPGGSQLDTARPARASPPRLGRRLRAAADAAVRRRRRCSCSTTSGRARRPARGAGAAARSPTSCRTPTSGPRASSRRGSRSRGAASGASSSAACPPAATIRIYTVRGDLVQTLRQDGSDAGFVAVEPAHQGQPRRGAGALHLPRRRRRAWAPSSASSRSSNERARRGHAIATAVLAALLWPRRRRPAAAQTKTGTTHRPVPADRAERAHRRDGQRRRRARATGSQAVYYNPARSALLEQPASQFTHAAGSPTSPTTTSRSAIPVRQLGHAASPASPRSTPARSTCAPSTSRSAPASASRVSDLAIGARLRPPRSPTASRPAARSTTCRRRSGTARRSTVTLQRRHALPRSRPTACASARASPTSAPTPRFDGPRPARSRTTAIPTATATTARCRRPVHRRLPGADPVPASALEHAVPARRRQPAAASRSTRSIPSDNTESVSARRRVDLDATLLALRAGYQNLFQRGLRGRA